MHVYLMDMNISIVQTRFVRSVIIPPLKNIHNNNFYYYLEQTRAQVWKFPSHNLRMIAFFGCFFFFVDTGMGIIDWTNGVKQTNRGTGANMIWIEWLTHTYTHTHTYICVYVPVTMWKRTSDNTFER